jgi:hypothetical protein
MERATLEAELQGLGMQLQAYNDRQFRDKSKIQYLTDMVNTTHPASIQRIQSDLAVVAQANLKQFISDRGVMLYFDRGETLFLKRGRMEEKLTFLQNDPNNI